MKNNLLKENSFEDLDNEKKIIFSNEEEYFNMKSKYDEIHHFRYYRKFILSSCSFLFMKRLLNDQETTIDPKMFEGRSYRSIRLLRIINHRYFKYTCGLALIYTAFKIENRIFQYDFSNKIKINTRFGLYIWFENNFRLGKLDYSTINYLDKNLINTSYLLVEEKNNNYNKRILDYMIFYQIMKLHFLKIFLSKTIINIFFPITFYRSKDKIDDRFLKRNLDNFYKLMSKERYYDLQNGIEEDKRLSRIVVKSLFPKELRNSLFNNENMFADNFELNENSDENIISKEIMELIIQNYQILLKLKDGLNDI